jgi:hypothetical protein
VKGVIAATVGVLMVACSAPLASKTVPPPGSTPPLADLASPPPPSVQIDLHAARLTFVPLTDAQLATVRVTAAEARRIALADDAFEYGSDGARVVWSEVGCIFLGYYTAPPQPSVGYVPPEFPAYLVQVLGDPVPDFPMINIGVVVVDATTGEQSTTYGAGTPPHGIMGTTCGATQ